MKTSNFRPDIQGLRAIAVLAVIAFHSGLPLPGGFVGVDIFFVISGFVITAMLLREQAKSGRVRFLRFYVRRARRLTPALALVVVFTIITSFFLLSPFDPQQNVAKTAIGAILNVPNLVISGTVGNYFDPSAESNPLLNTWSLGVEEQFYWIFPLILTFLTLSVRRAGSPRSQRLFVVFGLAAISVIFMAIATSPSFYSTFPWLESFYNPLPRFWEFGVGAALAILLQEKPRIPGFLIQLAGLSGTALIVLSLTLISDQTPFPGRWTLLPVAGTLFLILAGSSDNAKSLVTRGLSARPMVTVGDWSYSLYLWHWPFIVFAYLVTNGNKVIVLMAAILSFIPALLSYRFVENPLRFRRNWETITNIKFVIYVLVIPLLISITYLIISNFNARSEWATQTFSANAMQHLPYAVGCDFDPGSNFLISPQCEWNSELSGEPIYLVGDSQAGHFSEAVVGAGALVNRPTWVYVAGGCPFIPLITGPGSEHCNAYVEGTIDWLTQASKGTVIISMADARWIDQQTGYQLPNGQVSFEKRDKLELLSSGLENVVEILSSAGQEVVLVQSVPTFSQPDSYWAWEGCGLISLAVWSCEHSEDLATIDAQQDEVRRIFQGVAQTGGVSLIDLRSEFCEEEVCSNSREGELVYQDRTHIAVAESLRLAPMFAEKLLTSQ